MNSYEKLNLGIALVSMVLQNAHDAYRQYENNSLKGMLGSNYNDYLVLSKQIKPTSQAQAQIDHEESK